MREEKKEMEGRVEMRKTTITGNVRKMVVKTKGGGEDRKKSNDVITDSNGRERCGDQGGDEG